MAETIAQVDLMRRAEASVGRAYDEIAARRAQAKLEEMEEKKKAAEDRAREATDKLQDALDRAAQVCMGGSFTLIVFPEPT